jgi:hypothetical protein
LESDRCTNNIAEYEAVILGLRKLRALGVTTCIIRTYSKVVAGQVEKDYAAKDPALMQYLAAIRSLERQFKGFTLQHVDRAKNEEADALAKAAVRGEALPSDVFYHVIGTPAVRSPEGLQITNSDVRTGPRRRYHQKRSFPLQLQFAYCLRIGHSPKHQMPWLNIFQPNFSVTPFYCFGLIFIDVLHSLKFGPLYSIFCYVIISFVFCRSCCSY